MIVMAACRRQSGSTGEPSRENSALAAEDNCGLGGFPITRETKDLVADAPRDSAGANGSLLAKVAIGPDGQVTHLRVLRLAYPHARNAYEINARAVEAIKGWPYSPTVVDGRAVAVCSDVSVRVDLR